MLGPWIHQKHPIRQMRNKRGKGPQTNGKKVREGGKTSLMSRAGQMAWGGKETGGGHEDSRKGGGRREIRSGEAKKLLS